MNKLIYVLLFLFVGHPLLTRGQNDYSKAIEESSVLLDDLLLEYPGISVAVGVGNEIVWAEGFGLADAESNTKVDAKSQFMYYSLSKSILGVAMYDLYKKGLFDLDRPITEYISSLPKHFEKVSARHLLGHTAGVRHYNKGEWDKISRSECLNVDQALATFINDPLEFEPGSNYQYSSFGYVLLSHLLEKVTDQSFDDYFQSTYFDPLGMEVSRPTTEEITQNQTGRYSKWNAKKSSGKLTIVNNSCKFGGGSFVGTPTALVKFHMNVLMKEKKDDNSTLYQNLNKEGLSSYGYGIGINKKTENVYYVHTGSGRGGSAILIIYPKNNLVISMMGNIKGDGLKSNIGQIGNNFKKAFDN